MPIRHTCPNCSAKLLQPDDAAGKPLKCKACGHVFRPAAAPGERAFGGAGLMVQAPTVRVAVRPAADWDADGPSAGRALAVAARKAGAELVEHCAVREAVMAGNGIAGVVTDRGREPADVVVLAAGAWSREIGGIPPAYLPPVRPIKGQMLALRMDPNAPLLNHVVWAPGVYLVPRRDGRLIIGATVEEKAFDTSLTAGGLLTLLEATWRAVPSIEELPIEEMWVGHRPGSRDDAPVLGRGPVDGLMYATGHHRNGILLAPVTADAMARLILDDVADPVIRPFGLERFLPARAAE